MTQEEALKLLDEVQEKLRDQAPHYDDRLLQKQRELMKFIYG